MSGSSDAQASSESARRVNRSKRLWGFSLRSVPWRSNGKVDICRYASLAPNKTRAEIVFECQTRQRELKKFGIGRYVSPLLCRFDQACRYAAGQARILGLTEQPDGARLLEHEPVALKRKVLLGLCRRAGPHSHGSLHC